MSTRVYVGGLSHRIRERDVEKIVKKFGKIREIALKNGYGFVEFDDYRDADDACYELNGREVMGERLTVQLAKGTPHGRDRDRWGGYERGGREGRRPRSSPRKYESRGSSGGGSADRRPGWLDKYGPPTHTDFRLVVENLSTRVSWQDLKDYMRQAGDVTYADAHKNKRNEGYVEFANEQDMKTAIEKLDGTELNGKKIKLVQPPKNARRDSPSRKRSHSKSRSPLSRKRSRSSSPRKRSKSPSRRRSHSGSHSRSIERASSRGKSRSASPANNGDNRSRSSTKSPRRKEEEEIRTTEEEKTEDKGK